MMRRSSGYFSAGFSLIELVVVMALLGIMATAAVSGLMSLVHVVRVKSATQSIFSTMLLARSEAVKRNADVTITPVDEDDWGQGWRVESGGELILQQEAVRGVTVTLGPDVVTYTSHGRFPDGTAVPQFQLASIANDPAATRCINVDLNGRPRTFRGGC